MMYNNFLFDVETFGGNFSNKNRPNDPIYFEYFGLQNKNVITAQVVEESLPSRQIATAINPTGVGSLIQSMSTTQKTITVEGTITANSSIELEEIIFEMKKNINQVEGMLKITTMGGTEKYYTATLTNPESAINRDGSNITFCTFSLTFVCYYPYAHQAAQKINNFTANANFNFSLDNQGNTESDPIFILSFSSASDVNLVNFTNKNTGAQIQYEGEISTGDILVFDALKKTVQKNDDEVDFSGFFWLLVLGKNDISLDIDGDFELNLTTKFYNNYL